MHSVHDFRMQRNLPCIFNHGYNNHGCMCTFITEVNAGLGDKSWAEILTAAGYTKIQSEGVNIERRSLKDDTTNEKVHSSHNNNSPPSMRIEFDGKDLYQRIAKVDIFKQALMEALRTQGDRLLIENRAMSNLNVTTAFARLVPLKRALLCIKEIMDAARKFIVQVNDDGYLEAVMKTALVDVLKEEELTNTGLARYIKE